MLQPFTGRGMRPLYLYRSEDLTGVSGTGVVAVGVQLPSGKAVLEWCSRWKTVTVFESVEQITRIHGHGGRTVLHFGCPQEQRRAFLGAERMRAWMTAIAVLSRRTPRLPCRN